jgi:hypothetical protein
MEKEFEIGYADTVQLYEKIGEDLATMMANVKPHQHKVEIWFSPPEVQADGWTYQKVRIRVS